LEFVVKALIAGCVVSFASWLAGRNPGLAGFFMALPVSTAVLLPMVYFDTGSYAQTLSVARSIAVAVPLTLLFFVPFFLGARMGWGFWGVYAMAFGCLGGGFLIHRAVMKLVE
jgi:hypothetical protein